MENQAITINNELQIKIVNPMEKQTITRQELYTMVWQESLTAISKRLNIQYSHLRKICKEMLVPVPPNGHWSKLQFNKPVEILELPQDYSGTNEITMYPSPNAIGNPDNLTLHKKPATKVTDDNVTLLFKVPKTLTNPDDMIVKAQKQLAEYTFNAHNDHGMVRAEGAINIRVSRLNIGRALRFMDTLIKLLKANGHIIEERYSRALYIDGEQQEIKLMEKTQKLDPVKPYGFATYESTGLFYFEIRGSMGRTWTDGKVLIEEKLSSIFAKFESIISYWTELRRRQAEDRKRKEEQERIVREQQQRLEKEKSDFKDLYQQAKRWQRARFMREYINAYEKNAAEKGGLTDEVSEWISWAIEKVDWYDPLINKNKI